jgi:membrane-associated phospholipid phosphatase
VLVGKGPKRTGVDTPAAWLAVQNGQGPFGNNQVDPQPRFIRNGRDYCMYVHTDPNAGLFISFYNAGIWLFANSAPLNLGNPYRYYQKQFGFGTFGFPFFLGMIGECSRRAFEAAWYQKWFVHRNLRPEEFGGLVHRTITQQASYPLHHDVLKSAAVKETFSRFGSYLLPQAFPEGCPQFPAYPSGHATMAGACATLLKAAFDGSVPFASLTNGKIVMASSDGPSLVPYTGADVGQLTLNGEINKLASTSRLRGTCRAFIGEPMPFMECCWARRLRSAFCPIRATTIQGRTSTASRSRNSMEPRSRSDRYPFRTPPNQTTVREIA